MSELDWFDEDALKKDTAVPSFGYETVEDRELSEKEGKPRFKQLEYVKIWTGDKNNIVHRPVSEFDRKRWPRQYQQFLDDKEQIPDGIPLDELPRIKPDMLATCKALKLFTVEQVAHATENTLGDIGFGARELQKKAVSYLEFASSHGKFQSLETKIDALAAQVDLMNDREKEYKAEIAELRLNQKKRPGRPKNEPA